MNSTARELRKASSTVKERRARPGVELREVTDEEKKAGFIGALVGEIPFNTDSDELRDRSVNRGKPFVEQIAPDAFARSISEDSDIMGFAGHTDDPLAAFARIGENLTIEADGKAMSYRALVPDTQAGRDLLTNVRHKIIQGTSFEFNVNADGEKWEKRGDTDVRTITSARLYTVNPVAFPAYPDSELTAERGTKPNGQERSYYYGGSFGDPTVTVDCAYAMSALSDELSELCDALDYLRAAPEGALVKYAKAEVKESAASIVELTAWIAENGATINSDLLERSAKKLAEAREAALAQEKQDFSATETARDLRFRTLKLAPANQPA